MEMSSGTIEIMKGKERVEEEEENHVEQGRNAFIQANLRNLPQDNSLFLKRMRERFDRVGLNLPTVEVRFENLRVEAYCEVIRGKPLPTLFNTFTGSIYGMVKSTLKVFGFKFKEARIPILRDVSGLIMPSRMTLLLGPPSCGKTTLLRALASNLDPCLKDLHQEIWKFEEKLDDQTTCVGKKQRRSEDPGLGSAGLSDA